MNECCVRELTASGDKIEVDKSYFSICVEKLPYDSIFKALNAYDNDGKILSGLINFLNGITTWNSETKEWNLRIDFETYEWLDFCNMRYFQSLFSKIRNQNIELADILKLHAIYLFFSMYGEEFDSRLFKEWLRFSANIIEDSDLNNRTIVNSISSLSLLCSQFTAMNRTVFESSSYPGLDKLQIEEEVEKRRLSDENLDCGEEIILQEERLFGYFEGQLRYPLSYAGLWGKPCTQSALVKFRKACDILYSIFVKPSDNRRNMVYNLLTRALLTKGEYMVPVGNQGVLSLLVLNHRDYSWKRYLKEYDTNGLFSMLFNDLIESDDSDLSLVLKKIIKKCNIALLPSWRRILISNSRIMEKVKYCWAGDERDIWEISRTGTRNIWIDDSYSSDSWVIPIKGKNYSGIQSELFSLDVYTKLQEQSVDVSPFAELVYYRCKINNNDNEHPCAVLNEWRIGENDFAIDIARKDDKNIPATISVRFFDRNDKHIPSVILKVLSDFSMHLGDYGYYVDVAWENDGYIDLLVKLLTSLRSISSEDLIS